MGDLRKSRVAVIGSGFGGLATAIRLQAEGHAVTIFEKRDKPGGRAYVYRDAGFTFDAGPTVITAPHCIEELFEVAGRPMGEYVTLVPVSPLYRLHWEDGFRFDYTNDIDDTLAQIKRKAPGDVEGYRAFLRYTEEVFHEGYTKLAHVPFLHWSTMIKVSPQLVKLQAYRSVYSIVSKFLKDRHLREAFSFHSLLVGGNPFETSSIYTLIHFLERKWGVYFALGGTAALVEGLVRLFRDIGGEVRLDTGVDEITTAEGRVTGVVSRERKENFDVVVSNADVHRTYHHLLRKEPRARATARRLDRMRYSMSLFLIYFGTKRRYENVAHHNVLFGPRYRGLLDDIFHGHELAEDFSLYLHAPTRTDPSLAPENSEAFYVLSPVPHLGNLDIDWKAEGPKYADRILQYLDERYLPGLRDNLVTQRHFTPLDFKDQLDAHLGSAFSLEPLLRQSAYFRTHNRDATIRGLYFAGAGTHPGAGVPGVMNSGKATAKLVIDDNRESISVRAPAVAPSDGVTEALAECRQMIRVGSKSFSLAARFFSPETRDAAFFLYGWCRYCDDQVDRAEDATSQRARVATLRAATEDAFAGRASAPVFIALREVAERYAIPRHYALELIEGMAMDARLERYRTIDDLRLYCYRVAGVVGLMMSHIMGVSREGALAQAADLGTAMQLTNIARDVMEDAAMGRVYLPLEWLEAAGVRTTELADEKNRAAVAAVVARLLAEADRYYASGNRGLAFLPWRAAFSVATASSVYADIGTLVRRRGAHAWDRRAVTSPWRKARAVLRGAWMMARTIPHRVRAPFRRVPLVNVRRFA